VVQAKSGVDGDSAGLATLGVVVHPRHDVRASIDRSRSFRHRHRTTLPPDMIEVFVAVHGEPLQAALPGTPVHDRSGRSGEIRPRCLHRCLHLVPPILKAAFAWLRPKRI